MYLSAALIVFLQAYGSAAAAEKLNENIISLQKTSATFREIAKSIAPAVVHIRSDISQKIRSMGSGVITDKDGYILTSYHVVRNATKIIITLADRREYQAEMIAFDPLTDMAMLKIDAENIRAAELGNSNTAEVGDWVLAIGSPLGLQQTVTAGIISATGRDLTGEKDDPFVGYHNFIQTDAAIYEGNSGGPLVDLSGKVIAITHASIGRNFTGLSFATPINFIKNVMSSMKKGEGAPRGRLGVGLRNVNYAIARASGLKRVYGAQVQHVEKDTTAANAGLKTGDIILAIDGEEINNRMNLRSIVACIPLGKKINIKYFRRGRLLTADAVLYGGPTFILDKVLGLALMDLTKVIADQLGLEKPQGALIVSLQPKGTGLLSGLKVGMVIAMVNTRPTPDIRAYKTAIEKERKAKTLQLVVNIKGNMHLLRLKKTLSGKYIPDKSE
ncbi:MAG: trypsin-like peptidase domain-containing protein [Planctomycetota bacterium]